MPHRKPVGSRAQPASETHSSDAERMPSRRICRQLLSRHPASKAAPRTGMSMWVTCERDMHGSRASARGAKRSRADLPGGRHTHPKRKERQRAPPPTYCTARVIAAALDADTKEELGQQRDLGLQWRLERGRERGELSSAFAKRRAAHWMPSRRRGLRSVFATFFGKAKISRSQCLSSGATRPSSR